MFNLFFPAPEYNLAILQFFERLEMFQEESEFNRRAIAEQLRREESENIEKKLAFQNKAFRGQQTDVVDALKGIIMYRNWCLHVIENKL